ncbi:MAG: hypothetical protein LBR86_00510 [Tannerella sp.]|jgi:hypothetical protein|nr:hypothetical protein [Tannerella sp.]
MAGGNEIGKGALSGVATGAATGAAFGPWGALVGGAVGLGAGIFGGANAARKRRRMEQYLARQNDENTAWYNRNAYSDYTQRADVQAMMKNMREGLEFRNRSAANMAVVTGATPEVQAAQQEATNRAVSDAYAQLGALGQQYKDRVTDQYFGRKDMYGNQMQGMWNNQATGYENLMNNGLTLGAGGMAQFVDAIGARKRQENGA